MAYDKKEDISDLGTWNVASDYSKYKIMLPLSKCDIYEDVAKFGYTSFLEELSNLNIPIDELRINGLKRLINELLKLINNCRFAMIRGSTKKKVNEIETKLKSVLKIIPALYKITRDDINKSKVININEESFNKVLSSVLDLKSELNEPLNKNDLIFTAKDEFDPKKRKIEILQRLKTKG